MATISGSWTVGSTVGTLYFKVKYRFAGDSVWTTFNVQSSGTTMSFTGVYNRIYDIQYVNVNGSDNPSSSIVQGCGFSDPGPLLSPSNTSLAYSFNNLSADIDTYTCTVAQFSTPGNIIATHILTPATIVSDTFSGLAPLTEYYLTITPAANQFSKTFTYTFTTEAVATCAAPSGTIAILS